MYSHINLYVYKNKLIFCLVVLQGNLKLSTSVIKLYAAQIN